VTDINEVIAFYRARLDEYEQVARGVTGSGRWSAYIEGGDDGWAIEDAEKGDPGAIVGDEAMTQHIALHDPARVLKKVAAGRGLIRLYWQACDQIEMLAGYGAAADGSKVAAESYANTILVNAAVWDDHEDWVASWRPGWMDESWSAAKPLPHDGGKP
jgi:hypothetical protein